MPTQLITHSTWHGPLFGRQSALALVRVDTDAPGLLRLAAYEVASRTVFMIAPQPWPDAEATAQYQRAQALAAAGQRRQAALAADGPPRAE
jgi:hypothetical protein